MVGADEQAHHVRDDEADEADDAGDGDARGRDDRRDGQQDALRPLDLDTEALCVLLAEQHHVQVTGVGQQDEKGDGDQQEAGRDVEPRRALEVSHQPEQRPADALAGLEQEEGDDGPEERLDGDAGQQQGRDRRLAVARRDEVDPEGGDERPREGRAAQAQTERDGEGDDDEPDGPDRRARGDADDRGVGHRVPEDALHDGPCRRQREPDDGTQQDARQADLHDDLPLDVLDGVGER